MLTNCPYEIRLASCVRDFTSSLRNTLPKWYSTVLPLMKSCAAISRLVFPCATRREICDLLGSELVEGTRCAVPDLFSRRPKFDTGALGERLHESRTGSRYD